MLGKLHLCKTPSAMPRVYPNKQSNHTFMQENCDILNKHLSVRYTVSRILTLCCLFIYKLMLGQISKYPQFNAATLKNK